MGPGDRHLRNLEVYERRAADWSAQGARRTEEVRRFARLLAEDPDLPAGAVADLGCGPGWHLDELPEGTIALDGASAMLELATRRVGPGLRAVRADLRALPFARHSLCAAWADKSYVHLARSAVPMALWDLHRALAPGALASLGVFGGDQEHEGFAEDRFPGRSFSLWPDELLADVIEGAGFSLLGLQRQPVAGDGVPHIHATLRRERTLADTVGPGMRLLLVGLNPSLHAADSGVGFSGPSNRGWPALLASGLATTDRDPVALLRDDRIGMTDLVKRATPRASELRPAEYGSGLARLDRLCAWLGPAAVCVVGLTGWREAVDPSAAPGLQDRRLGGRPVWLMPNPSGLNAHVRVEDLSDSLRRAAELADAAG